MAQKSIKTKLKEGRCQGYGRDYVPFYKANEAGSLGTASMISDPIEGRLISVMSQTEKLFYYIIRWNDDVEHIREQYRLEPERINEARQTIGLKPVSGLVSVYTTDFLVDYKDGTQHAYSVKWKADLFNPESSRYKEDKTLYYRLIKRERIEQLYWESLGVPFSIVTSDNMDKRYAENIEYVMSYYSPMFIKTREQKMMHLIAHKKYLVPMNEGRLNPKEIADNAGFNIDEALNELRKEEAVK